MLDHDFESVSARLFAELCPDGDIPADYGLQAGADSGKYVSRAHDNSSHHTEVLYSSVVWQLESRSHHLMRNGITRPTHWVWNFWLGRIHAHRFSFCVFRRGFLNRLVLLCSGFARCLGIQRYVCNSQRPCLLNLMPSASSILCCLS